MNPDNRRLKLRTQLLLALAFVELFTVGMGLSYWVQAQARSRLDNAFREDLAVLTKLPELRADLAELDDATDRYLIEGDPKRLESRHDAVVKVWAAARDIAKLIESEPERRKITDIERRIADYISQQEQWIERRRSGKLARPDAVRIAALTSPFEDIAGSLTGLREVSAAELEQRRSAVNTAANVALGFVLATGLISSLLLAFFLSKYLIEPVLALERAAGRWDLGKPWETEVSGATPEIDRLARRMREMAERLNLQFKRERELAEMKTQLVSMVSHEFNNAMTVITGVTALLEDSDGEPKPKREKYYQMIKDNVKALMMMSSNLINMGRLESGRFALSMRRTDAGTLLVETMNRLEVLSARKDLTVSLELPEAQIPVNADPEALTLVITNLLSNAIKYTPAGGSVSLGLFRVPDAPGEVEVFCRDSGIGISPEDRERILAGYYRTETGRRAAKGFGVGLALANSLVEAHGSSLRIESAPGKGSTFSFRLRAWTEGAAEPAVARAA